MTPVVAGPEPVPPPGSGVAPRGSAQDVSAATSAAHLRQSHRLVRRSVRPGVPSGCLREGSRSLESCFPTAPCATSTSTAGRPPPGDAGTSPRSQARWLVIPEVPDPMGSAPAWYPAGYPASGYPAARRRPAHPSPTATKRTTVRDRRTRLRPTDPPDGRQARIFDVHAFRADFPILRETVSGKPLIWFDNAATTLQKPQAVIDRISYFYGTRTPTSIGPRTGWPRGQRMPTRKHAKPRVVHRAPKSSRSSSSAGTTEAINLVAKAWGGKHLQPGDEIVITNLEHHANIVPWQMIARQTGAVIKVAPVDDAGNLLLNEFERLLGPRTKIVSATQVSNALGTVTPVEKIVGWATGTAHGY